MRRLRVGWRLISLKHPVIAHHLRHAQAIPVKYAAASDCLRGAMSFELAPLRDRRFIAPE